MRVLLCTGEFPPDPATGGLGTAVRAAAAALAGSGVDTHVLHVQTGLVSEDRSDPSGFVVHRRPGPGRLPGPIARSGVPNAIAFRFHAERLGPFDVVEAPDWEAAVAGFTIGRRQPVVAVLNTPTEVIRAHGGTAGNSFREHLERWGVRRSDVAVSLGPSLRRELAARTWHDRSGGISVRPPCLTPEQVALRATPIPEGAMVLGVGRIEPRKGFDLLVEAVARLRPRSGTTSPSVTIVGRDVDADDGRTHGEHLSALARRLDVDLSLVPPVPLAELTPWFERAWVVAVPSTFESFSMVGLEAAAHGRAVLTTETVGFGELLAGSRGVRIAAAEPDAQAAALADLLAGRHTAERAGAAARSVVLDRFAPSRFAEARLELYARLTGGDSGDHRSIEAVTASP